jgi:hypothetical protein
MSALGFSSAAANLTPAEIAMIGEHKAGIRKAFIRAAGDLNKGEWTTDDDAALDAATTWLAELVQRAHSKPKQITSGQAAGAR